MRSSAVALLFVSTLALSAMPLAAQPSTSWAPCTATAAPLTLGGRTIEWRTVLTPGMDARLESRIARAPAAAGQAPPAPGQPLAVFCVQPSARTFPSAEATTALVLAVAARSDMALLSLEIYRGSTLVQQSDGSAAQHSAILSSQPAWPGPSSAPAPLFAVVTREDAGSQPETVTSRVDTEPLVHDARFEDGTGWFVKSLSEGHAFIYTSDAAQYEKLVEFARCDWVADEARRETATTPGCFSSQMELLEREVYPFVSTVVGRSYQREFVEGQPRAPLSEPMVVFFGLGGANRILLLDCRDAGTTSGQRRCAKYAEPWQTTLQRARYVWAVYIEDEQTPYNTSIDVEFKPKAATVDYEEYDPRGLARPLATTSGTASRLVRIGYRRLRVREPPVAVQVAFSRQGPNYGLRQWVRVYRQFSARWWVASGAVFVPFTNNTISHIELEPILPPEGGPATRARIVDDQPAAPVYATAIWRWPQVRGRADNQARASTRLMVNLIPDVIGGLSLPPRRHNSYLAGGSWPILADRLSFVMGAKIYRDEVPTSGWVAGQYVPIATTVEEVRGTAHHHVDFLFGLAVELVRSR
jgi:hypothetical protein